MIKVAPALCTRRVGTTHMNGKKRGQTARNRIDLHGRISPVTNTGVARANTSIHPDRPRASSRINDNYCVNKLQERLLARSPVSTHRQTMNTFVNSNIVEVVHTAPELSQKKEIGPGSADCYYHKKYKLKYVKGVSFVTQLSCVKPVNNVKNAASNLPVGARLRNYWQT